MYTEFIKDKAGAQIIEYALIIAALSINLVLALQPTVLGASFQGFITRLRTFFSTGPCA